MVRTQIGPNTEIDQEYGIWLYEKIKKGPKAGQFAWKLTGQLKKIFNTCSQKAELVFCLKPGVKYFYTAQCLGLSKDMVDSLKQYNNNQLVVGWVYYPQIHPVDKNGNSTGPSYDGIISIDKIRQQQTKTYGGNSIEYWTSISAWKPHTLKSVQDI
jgi:hypothetical protein